MKYYIVAAPCILLLAISFEVASSECADPPEPAGDSVMFRIDAKRGFYVPYNQTAQTTGFLDYKGNISGIFRGDGSAFLFHYERSDVVYIPPETTPLTWYSSRQSFNDFFAKIPNPSELYALGQKRGQHFEPDTLPPEIAEKMAADLSVLSQDYSSQCAAMSTSVQISKITSDDLKESLSGFEENVGDNFVECRGDMKWLIWFIQGLGDFFTDFPGGISTLTKNNVRIDFRKIATEPSGFHVLSYLIALLAPHFDLGKISANRLNSQDSFFSLMNKLGGNVDYYSFDGSVFIMSQIVDYNFGKNSEESLRDSLRHFYGSPRVDHEDLSWKWRQSVQDLLRTINKYKLTKPLKPLVDLLIHIFNKKWTHHCVNMSKVLDLVISTKPPGNENAIKSIIELLHCK